MPIRIYNTLTSKKEVFQPVEPGSVGMYVCGVTVYDECHIGHLRGAFTFDVIRRYFEYKGYKVRYVRNITDIDDKIIERAKKELNAGVKQGLAEKVREVAERYTRSYYDDMEAFGIKKADIEPKATDHIKEMIQTIERLIEKGYAYVCNGGVYFEVRRFDGYGKLSGQALNDMEAGARIDINEDKKDPLDFALWKSAKEDEPFWESPWGRGRPGWHIECSSMSTKYLGDNFDIHGGGIDLVFPHHENEIAQSECSTGKRFANYWIHNGLLTINSAKMAKSLGNFVTIKDIVDRYGSEVLKIFFLSSHYRSPVDFTYERMEEAKKARERFCILLEKLEKMKNKTYTGHPAQEKKADMINSGIAPFISRFDDAMADDFNTAVALASLFDLVTYINKKIAEGFNDGRELGYIETILLKLTSVFGLFEGYRAALDAIDPAEKSKIEHLIKLRNDARNKKNFNEADRIRDELNKIGIIVEDERGQTIWRFK